MNFDFKVGITGFGGAGRAIYNHFQSLKGCKVVSVYDTKEAGLERARSLSKSLELYDNYDEFLGSDIDIVAICSPDSTHAGYMVKSLNAKKHTICEKPLTDSAEGYKNIIEATENNKECVAAVQHQMRFLPVHTKMKEIIQKGELGKIFYAEGYYVHNLTERASLYDDWRFKDKATPLVYSGCHFIDLLRWLLQEEIVEVAGMANNIAFSEYPESDLNVVLLRFRSGAIGKVITAFGAARPQDHSVRVYGNKKSIENNILFSKTGGFSIFHRPLLIEDSRNTEIKYKIKKIMGNIRRNIKPYSYGIILKNLLRLYKGSDQYSLSNYPFKLYEHEMAVKLSIVDFLESIKTGSQPKCTVIDSAKTIAVCLAGVEAYRTKKIVPVSKYWIPEFGRL